MLTRPKVKAIVPAKTDLEFEGEAQIEKGVLPPAVQASRESVRRARRVNNLRQIGLTPHNFESARGTFPPATSARYSLQTAILPHLDHVTLYDALNFSVRGDILRIGRRLPPRRTAA